MKYLKIINIVYEKIKIEDHFYLPLSRQVLSNESNKSLFLDNRLFELTKKDKELKVSEEDFKQALKGYNLDQFLIELSKISIRLFDNDFHENETFKKQNRGFIIHKRSNQFITDFAVEYIANILLISKSNKYKRESIKNRDNLIGIFSIYHSYIVHPKINKERGSLPAIMVPMYYRQLSSQQDIKHTLVRQWLLFDKAQKEIPESKRIDLNQVLLAEKSLSIIEYVKLSFLILAAVLAEPRFRFGNIGQTSIPGLTGVFTEEKIRAILNHLATTKEHFLELDNQYNQSLGREYSLSRYNPLWEKPIIILGQNDFIVPSLSAYAKGALRGLYWVFENVMGKDFRDYFGLLFEYYCGMVIKDVYGSKNIRKGIILKNGDEFFDWIFDGLNETLLFETKAYQFPLKTLQTGDLELIKKAVRQNLVETIEQMYKRCIDIQHNEELAEFLDKKIVCVAVFYDVPFVSTNAYQEEIDSALVELEDKLPGIKNFEYLFLSIEELENYSHIQSCISLNDLFLRVKRDAGNGFTAEAKKVFEENNLDRLNRKTLIEIEFENFYTNELGLSYND